MASLRRSASQNTSCLPQRVGAERYVLVELDCGALLGSWQGRRVKFPVAFLDSARPLVSGNGDADVVRADALAYGRNFLLRLAVCQSKDLITEIGLAAISGSRFRRCGAPAPA